jgi:hypothetical protein
MAVTQIFVPHAVQVKTAGAAVSDWIDEIKNVDADEGIELFEESGSSEADREFVAIRTRNPSMRFQTLDLSFLTVCGLSGIAISADASNPGLVAWGRCCSNKAVRDLISAVTNVKLECSDGLLVPVSLGGSHNQAAMLSMALHAILGSGAQSLVTPFVLTKDVAITAGAGALSLVYVPSTIKYTSGAAVIIAGIQDIQIDFGIQVVRSGGDSEVDPTYVYIQSRNPSISFTSVDLEKYADIGSGGKACTTFGAYFQKVTANGERLAKVTAEHIAITSTSGLLTRGAVSMAHQQSARNGFRFTPVLATNILTLSAAAAIPTT